MLAPVLRALVRRLWEKPKRLDQDNVAPGLLKRLANIWLASRVTGRWPSSPKRAAGPAVSGSLASDA